MRKNWQRWLGGVIAAILIVTNVPVSAFAYMDTGAIGKPTSITTSEGEAVQVEETWEEAYPYGAFLFTNSDATLTEGGDACVIPLYRLGGTSGRATAYVVYAPVVTQLNEEITSYGSAAGYGDVEIAVEEPLPIAQYQPVGKDPEPEPSDVRILEKKAEGEEAQPDDRALYLGESADSYQWYVLYEDRWEPVEGATGAEFVVSEDLLGEYDFRCVFTKDGERFSTDSIKGEAYVRPGEEVLPKMPEDLDLSPEKTFAPMEMDAQNPCEAIILPVTFADGEWVKEIRVSAPDNDKAQPLRFGTFTILEHNGGEIFEKASTVTLRLTDNDADEPYSIRFEETEVLADKSEGTATVRLCRVGGGQDPVTVDYATVDGTAVAGKDYESVSGTAVFYADIHEVTINIPLIGRRAMGEEPLTFKVALGELKGDSRGICTLEDRESVIRLVDSGAGLYAESAEGTGDAPEEEADAASGEDVAGETGEASGDALPYGAVADAFREGAENAASEPVTGDQVVTPPEELLYGDIAGLEGSGKGGPLKTYNYGQITFNGAHGGDYWEDLAYIAGKANNALTNWKGGSAYGNGWQIADDSDASATLNIEHMPQMYSKFYGHFAFSAGLDNGWHFTNGYAYGWASMDRVENGKTFVYASASSNPKLTTSGIERHLTWTTGGSINTSWDMKTDVRSITLWITEHKHASDDDVYCRITEGRLTRRVFSRNLNLRIHTANDGESGNGNVATAPEGGATLKESTGVYKNMKPEVLIKEKNGGVNSSGRLYVGSELVVSLRNTDSYKPLSGGDLNSAVYVTRSDGSIVNADVKPGANGTYYVTLLWDNMTEADLSDTYTVNIVMTRRQKLELNFQPSTERIINKDGSVSNAFDPDKLGNAWDDFWASGSDVITAGCSEMTSEAPHFDGKRITERQIRKTSWASADKNPQKILDTLDNVQYINFNRSNKDRILFNGRMYKGDERIYLSTADLSFQKLTFIYYAEKYLNRPDIMSMSVTRAELYFDGDGDGKISGSYNEETGYFILDEGTKDTFELYLDEGASYDEVMFQPEKLENGRFGQYFAKIFYTMTPRSLEGSDGYAQVLPALTTTRTEDVSRAKLTEEQKSYRYLLSGKNKDGVRTSDKHPMYGAMATAPQYVDVPLGGDRSPLEETSKDVYKWEPQYVGNLLYPFSDPEPIYIEHSLAGDNYPLADVQYDKNNGISIDAQGKANLNGYLGSFVADTVIALCVTEQRLTADELHDNADTIKNLKPESSTLSRRSAAPNGAWLTQMDSGNMGDAGFDSASSGQSYSDFNMDYDLDLPITTESFQGLATVVTGKNSIIITISVPIYTKMKKNDDPAAGKWFPSTVKDPMGIAAEQIGAYCSGMKNGSYDQIMQALKGKGGFKETNGGQLKSKKTSVTVSFTAAITLKYDTRDNAWYVQEFVFGAGAAFSFKYTVRFAFCPLIYGFVSVNVGATVTTGGTIMRHVRESKYPLFSDGKSKQLKKGESLTLQTPYVNANIDFSGKIYIKTEAVGSEELNNGYLRSKGGTSLPIQFKKSKSSMYFDKEKKARKITIYALEDTTINYVNTVESIESELVWSGVKIMPKLIAEAGVGAGVEGINVEAFIKIVVSASFTFGKPKADGSREKATVDSASFALSLAIRAVLFMASWEINAVGLKADYDGTKDKWTLKYTLWGKDNDFDSGNGLAGAGEEELMQLPTAIDKTQTIYSSQPDSMESPVPRLFAKISGMLKAYKPDDPNVPFELSGYNSSSEAFRLADGLELGCDYKVVAVDGVNYVVYTIGRPDARGMDTTMLALSRLVLGGEGYGQNAGQEEGSYGDGLGLVNPLDWEEYTDEAGKTRRVVKAPNERSEIPYILVDLKEDASGRLVDDGTGDQEFDVKVIGNKIQVAWVSYAEPVPNPSPNAQEALQNAIKNTVIKQAAYDVTGKEGFTAAKVLSDPRGGASVYSPKIVNEKYTAYVRAGHADAERRAQLVAKYTQKLNAMGYYADQGDEAKRSIFRYRLLTYENNLDYKGISSEICVCVHSDEGVYENQKTYTFRDTGGSEGGYAQGDPIPPIDRLAFFEKGTDIYAAYTTWREDPDAADDDIPSFSGLYLTSFADRGPETGIICPYGHVAVTSDSLDASEQNTTLLVYEERAAGTSSSAAETLLFVGQGGKVFMIPSDSMPAYLRAKGAGAGILEKTAFSGGDSVERTDFSFGRDGDGHLVAVYTSTVPNTTNTGIYISVYDRANRAWGAGTILAMRHMDVYEDAAKHGWSDEDAEKAYLGELSGYSDGEGAGKGGMDQFQFVNPQIALGTKADEAEGEATNLSNSNTTLTILTQGMMNYLAYKETQEGERFLTSGAEPPEGAAFKKGMGVYAISYGVGHQTVGQASLSFVTEQFTADSLLNANLSFMNTGDVSIRGSEDAPVTVTLSVEGDGVPDTKLTSWKVKDNIYPGRKVELNGSFVLPVTLPAGAGFILSVSEDETYAEDPYFAALKDIYTVREYSELDFVESAVALSLQDNGSLALDEDGNTLLDVDLLVGNRGVADAENVYLQFSYGVHDPNLASKARELVGEGESWNDVIYKPLDITSHELIVGDEEQPLAGYNFDATSELRQGIFRLSTIASGYGRRIRGTITVPADAFSVFGEDRIEETAGSLRLRVEAFSSDDEVTSDAFGLHAAERREYNSSNNICEVTIEHRTAFVVPKFLEVPVGSLFRLPVYFSSTLGSKKPEIDAAELLDREVGEDIATDAEVRTDVLTWKLQEYQNGQGNGTLILRGVKTGVSYLRILDNKTNTYQDIAITFTPAAKGLDIINSNDMFTFLNQEGEEDGGSERDWSFQEHILTWRNTEAPFMETLALGQVGASFRFTTEAEAFALDFHGEITVTSDFPGFKPVTVGDEGKMRLITLGENPDNKPHTVTVTVETEAFPGTKDTCAYFDRLVEFYAGDNADLEDLSPVDPEAAADWKDADGFNLVWEGHFPEPASLAAGEVFETTVSGIINGVLEQEADNYVSCEGDNAKLLSVESFPWGDYGQRFEVKVRFTGNGPVRFKLENDKNGAYAYHVNVDWWAPGASAFTQKEDPVYEAYKKKYESLADIETPETPQKPVDHKWLQAEPDERGGAVAVSIDEDAPAESFTVYAVPYDQYLETGRLPENEAITVLRGSSVSIPAGENSVIYVYAEALKQKGDDASLDYEIRRNDGTVEKHNAKDAYYHNSALIDMPEVEELLGFKTQSLVLSGQIGVNFFMNLPNIPGVDYQQSFMEFTVCGNTTVEAFDENAKNSSGKYFRFTRYVNSVQMADEIHAVFHYFKKGEERTVEKNYSIRQYVEEFDAQGGYGEKVTELVHALADYGHHAQPYLSGINGWQIGTDHLEMDRCYKKSYSRAELLSAQTALQKMSFTTKKSKDVTNVSSRLSLDSGTELTIFFTMAKGFKGSAAVTVDGTPREITRLDDGRYQLNIPDIAAHRLGQVFEAELVTGAGKTTVKASVLAYAGASLRQAKDTERKNAMIAIYRYYAAAAAYLKETQKP